MKWIGDEVGEWLTKNASFSQCICLHSTNRAELKKELETLKESLASKLAGKRAADHLLFKMEAEVKRAARAIEQLEEECAAFASRLEEVTLETETSKKSHGKI